jgi:hypothetical protein
MEGKGWEELNSFLYVCAIDKFVKIEGITHPPNSYHIQILCGGCGYDGRLRPSNGLRDTLILGTCMEIVRNIPCIRGGNYSVMSNCYSEDSSSRVGQFLDENIVLRGYGSLIHSNNCFISS